jgi:hypothetical protein
MAGGRSQLAPGVAVNSYGTATIVTFPPAYVPSAEVGCQAAAASNTARLAATTSPGAVHDRFLYMGGHRCTSGVTIPSPLRYFLELLRSFAQLTEVYFRNGSVFHFHQARLTAVLRFAARDFSPPALELHRFPHTQHAESCANPVYDVRSLSSWSSATRCPRSSGCPQRVHFDQPHSTSGSNAARMRAWERGYLAAIALVWIPTDVSSPLSVTRLAGDGVVPSRKRHPLRGVHSVGRAER